MMEESASAAENAWSGDLLVGCGSVEAEHTIIGLAFWKEGELSLGLRGLERFVGMVRDIVGELAGELDRNGDGRVEDGGLRNGF